MASKNLLTLAVAGSRKTQSVIDECAASSRDYRILILTYTRNNQQEVRTRLAKKIGDHPNIEVMGWFAFLLAHFVRPFSPLLFPGSRLTGFDNDSPYQRGKKVDNQFRYFTADGKARKAHLPQLALEIDAAAEGIPIWRLEELYDRIYIDEVQDLCGYDLDVLSLLLKSRLRIRLVGDVRQATLVTNHDERRNKKYFKMGINVWFKEQESRGRLEIIHKVESYRCHPKITEFADQLFDESWGFKPTVSLNRKVSAHDGVFLVQRKDAEAYNHRFSPLGLRASKDLAQDLPFDFMNFGEVKGLGRKRVVIEPTGAVEKFLRKGTTLKDQQAANLYVAVTRAEQSVAIILDDKGNCSLPYWSPSSQEVMLF